MIDLTCLHCGAAFSVERPPGTKGRKPGFCSKECKLARRAEQWASRATVEHKCSECGTRPARQGGRKCNGCHYASRSRIPCSVCGEPTGWTTSHTKHVDPTKVRCRACTRAKCGTVASYGRGCRCERCRAAVAQAMRDYAARRRADGRPIRRPGRTDTFCCDCGERLLTGKGKGEGAPRCSPCGIRWRSNIRSAKRRRARLERFVREQAAGTPANPRWPWVQGDCAYCGETFTRKGMASGYCSKRCRRKDKKAKWITTTRRMALYARDEWTCQLCFEPVDRDADPLSDWSPTLDHIVPQSHALIPDHSDENLRTAHRWCNSVRGDGRWHADFFEEAS